MSWPAEKKSLTIDKLSLKALEHELINVSDFETIEVISDRVCGFLGILSIYGENHLVIATDR